jgi:hypothetical protein
MVTPVWPRAIERDEEKCCAVLRPHPALTAKIDHDEVVIERGMRKSAARFCARIPL